MIKKLEDIEKEKNSKKNYIRKQLIQILKIIS